MYNARRLDFYFSRLVEVAPGANPPVCKVMDYGKFKYEKEKTEKEAKKKQKKIIVKEMKFKPRIESHDVEVKCKKIESFLKKGNKVKITLMLFGRERMHTDLGIKVLEEVAERFKEDVVIERKYAKNEKQKYLILSPKK
ncbi:MAG: translation initiation factor IF-3 [Fusobacteriia bacterium 4572_132]|nr:MAG: translation initiation factor IF-3 [Fusobacteriia bacterium 4572_132]